MCRRYFFSVLLGLLLAMTGLSRAERVSLRVLTESYPPYNMSAKNGAVVGLSTEIVREMMKRAKVPYTIELQQWVWAFTNARDDPGTCVYSTTRNEEREAQFKWVGPLVDNPWVLYARANDERPVHTLEDVRPYLLGGYVGDATAQYLMSNGYRVELVPADVLNMRKLASGRIDFWATGKYQGAYLAAQQKQSDIHPVLTFKTVQLYLACNKAVGDPVIQKLNASLNGMREEGLVQKIIERYLH